MTVQIDRYLEVEVVVVEDGVQPSPLSTIETCTNKCCAANRGAVDNH